MEAASGNSAPAAPNSTTYEPSQETPAEYSDDGHLSAIDKQYASTPSGVPRRIHILGTGSIGKLVAHSLKGIAKPPPITLLLHRYKLIEAWEAGKKQVTIHSDGYDEPRSGFEVELMPETRREHGMQREDRQESVYDVSERDGNIRPHEAAQHLRSQQGQSQSSDTATIPTRPGKYPISSEPINNLIVTTKAAMTVSALSAIKNRISPTTTICFLQNGMGIIDEVNRELFPDEKDRPNYIQGIITHGANVPPDKAAQDPFYAVHAGHGSIALGLIPRDISKVEEGKDEKDVKPEQWAASSRYLLRTLTRCPVLCAVGFTPTELLQLQLEKLVTNSVINPLTSLLDNRNGSILYNFALTRTMRLLLAETSHVICNLPELQGIPNVQHRFSTERLETNVVGMANKTKDNISSMLADVRAGNKTEIEYINGYIVKRGEEQGVKCLVNYAIMQTVIGKAQMTQREKDDDVPTDKRNLSGR